MSQAHQSDPIDSALDYKKNVSSYVKQIEAEEAAEQAAEEAEEAAEQERIVAAQTPSRSGGSSDLPYLLQKIRSCESSPWRETYPQCGYDLSKYSYTAYNADGCEGYGCGGAYQLHARYATVWAERAGYPGLGSNAAMWSPATQDAVALELFYSTNPDGAHWCNWTDYC